MEFEQANVQKLIGFMEQVEDADLPKMVYAVKKGDTNAIELKDFSVGYEAVNLLNPQTMIIPQGVYGVSGVAERRAFFRKFKALSIITFGAVAR